MRWRRVSDSPDVIDQRGGSGFCVPGGARVWVPGGLGLGGLVIVLLIQLLGGGGSGTAFDVDPRFGDEVQAPGGAPIPASQDPERDLKDFSVYVFRDVQRRGGEPFPRQRSRYEHAKLVL